MDRNATLCRDPCRKEIERNDNVGRVMIMIFIMTIVIIRRDKDNCNNHSNDSDCTNIR